MFIQLSPHLDAQRSSSTDSSTSAAQIVFECDGIDAGADDKSVEELSKSRKIVKKSKKSQRSEKFAKAIGSEKRLPKHWSSVNKELKFPLKF